ncbi:hypothetical protein X777_12952, partial [Ooceraea biroi]
NSSEPRRTSPYLTRLCLIRSTSIEKGWQDPPRFAKVRQDLTRFCKILQDPDQVSNSDDRHVHAQPSVNKSLEKAVPVYKQRDKLGEEMRINQN